MPFILKACKQECGKISNFCFSLTGQVQGAMSFTIVLG